MAKQQREKANASLEVSGPFQVKQQEGRWVRHSNSISVPVSASPRATHRWGGGDMVSNESKSRKGPKPPKTQTGTLVSYWPFYHLN